MLLQRMLLLWTSLTVSDGISISQEEIEELQFKSIKESAIEGVIGATAIVVGEVIGAFLSVYIEHKKSEEYEATEGYGGHVDVGGCHWYGTGPFCYDNYCPFGHEYIDSFAKKKSRGHYSFDVASNRQVMSKFGKECLFKKYKHLCCRSIPGDCSLGGIWELVGYSVKRGDKTFEGLSSGMVHCTVHKDSYGNSQCGKISCNYHGYEFDSDITGPYCNKVILFGSYWTTYCGKMVARIHYEEGSWLTAKMFKVR